MPRPSITTLNNRLRHSALTAPALIFALAAPVLAKADPSVEDEVPSKSAFPTLDILPEGSILQRVRLPRYDKDFNPTSLLTADKLTVINRYRVDGEEVSIELYDKNGESQVHTLMHHAVYNQKDATLKAEERITLHGKSYRAEGKGLIFHLENNRGFLFGPASTQFNLTETQPSSVMRLPSTHSAFPLAGVLMTLTTTSLIAAPPSKVTAEQLAELDQITKPSKAFIENSKNETSKSLQEEQKDVSSANADMVPFLKKIGQDTLLIQSDKPAPKSQNMETAKPDPKAPKEPQLLRVECDGGVYFDTDTGILAYLKNIRLTEPRFKLTCSDELKIFLGKKSDQKVQPGTKPTQPDKKEKKNEQKDALADSFGDLKRIIAIGQVKVVRKDDKGQTYIATAETASYDAQSGEMILRGKTPRIQVGPRQFIQSESPGKYIKIEKTGKFIIEGKATTVIDTNQPKPSKKPSKTP